MDINKLTRDAQNLCVALTQYARNNEDAACALNELLPLFEKIDNKEIKDALNWNDVPAKGFFHSDGPLAHYKDLDALYSELSVEITGGVSQELLERFEQNKKKFSE